MAKPEVISKLNALFAEEVEAGLRYLHLAVTLKGFDRLLVGSILLEAVKETLEHAQALGEKLVQLGTAPSLNLKLELPPERVSGIEAVRQALAFETEALDAYRELLGDVDGDVELEDFVRGQISIEARHVSALSLLLEE